MDWWHGIGRKLSIDLANTASDQHRADVLATPDLFAQWLARTGAPDSVDRDELFGLRDAVVAVLVARAGQRRFPRAAVERLNATARRAAFVPQLDKDELVYVAAASPDESFLADIAASAIELVGAGGTVRRCAAGGCERLVTGRADRRWCGDGCGNRQRVSRHRARRRGRS